MATVLADISFATGSNNIPGLTKLFFASYDDILNLPSRKQIDPTVGSGSLADLSDLNGNIVMKAGKKFHNLYITPETGEIRNELQGEIDGHSYKIDLEFLHPGNSSEVNGFATLAANGRFIFIAQDMDGNKFMIGNDKYPARLTANTSTIGKAPADRKGKTFTFTYHDVSPVQIFTGDINQDGSSGSGAGEPDGFDTIVG